MSLEVNWRYRKPSSAEQPKFEGALQTADSPCVTELTSRMLKRVGRAYSTALYIFFWVGLCGLAMCLVGTFVREDLLVQIGTCLFLSLFAGWALVNGGVFVWGLVQAVRRCGWAVLVESLWSSALYLGIMIFFLWFGSAVMWMIIKAAMHTPGNR
jgi:hypothetical protein